MKSLISRNSMLALTLNIGSSASWIFIPILASEIGASYIELGIIGGAFGLSSFFSNYFFGRLSDVKGRRMIFVKAGTLLCSVSFLSQVFMKDFFSIFSIRAFVGFTMGVYSSPLIAYVSATEDYKNELSKFSAFGALGWFIGNLSAAVLGVYKNIFLLASSLYLIGFFVAWTLPEVEVRRVAVELLPISLIRRNLRLYSAFFLRHLAANSIWVTFPIFLISLGANKFWVGVLNAVNTITQFLVMQRIGVLSKRVGETLIIKIGFFISSLVFIFYSFAGSFYAVIPIQVLLGLSWSTLYVGSLIYLTGKNIERSTSTGILNSILSLSSVVGPILGGVLNQLLDFSTVMLIAFLMGVISFLIFIRAK